MLKYKTTNVLKVVKIKRNLLVINHFIIIHKTRGMVNRRSRRWVPWRLTTSNWQRHCFSMLLSLLWIQFWLDTQESNTRFEELLIQIYNVLQNRETLTKQYQQSTLDRVQIFFRRKKRLIVYRKSIKHISPLCLNVLCRAKK